MFIRISELCLEIICKTYFDTTETFDFNFYKI